MSSWWRKLVDSLVSGSPTADRKRHDKPGADLKIVADGRFLHIYVTNLGAKATFRGRIQPGRGTASAAIQQKALWDHEVTTETCTLATGQSARFRVVCRDRPPTSEENGAAGNGHPDGARSWRMCYLRKGVGESTERVCPVTQPVHHDTHGIVLTLLAEPERPGDPPTKTIHFDGEKAFDPDSREDFTIDDTGRHYPAIGSPYPD
jgi:hypothetical protein